MRSLAGLATFGGRAVSAAPASAGATATKTHRNPIYQQPFSEPAGVVCLFQLNVEFLFQRSTRSTTTCPARSCDRW
jgi:hypothetical protein